METICISGTSKARQTADAHFDRAAEALGLSDPIKAFMKTPFRAIRVTIPLTMDDGIPQLFVGYRIQHNDLHTPIMGGIRYHPTVDESELGALAENMTWRAALVRIPVGGAMGGVRCDPKVLSKWELRRITQKYIARIHHILGPHSDIPAPDVNTNSEVMSWILQEYGLRHGHNFACVTGKPGYLEGLMDPHRAASKGAAIVLSKHLSDHGHSLNGMDVVVQGFGNVGSTLALELAERGCKIVAVSDVDSGVASKNGESLHIPKLIQHVEETGSVSNFPGTRTIDRDKTLSLDCEILVTAAMECAINENNADDIKASIIAEAANLPTSFEADEMFERKGITVLPDILTNAGATICSYFEWKQNLHVKFPQDKNPDTELFSRLTQAYEDVRRYAGAENMSLKKAAYAIALERIAVEEAKHNY